MHSLVRSLACTVLALSAGTVSYSPLADEQTVRSAQLAEAAARHGQEAQRRQRDARLRWEYELRRSGAHARMPNTLYASTPSSKSKGDLSCPVLVDEDSHRIHRRHLDGRGGALSDRSAFGLIRSSGVPRIGHHRLFRRSAEHHGLRFFRYHSQGWRGRSPYSDIGLDRDAGCAEIG